MVNSVSDSTQEALSKISSQRDDILAVLGDGKGGSFYAPKISYSAEEYEAIDLFCAKLQHKAA
jgi:hypothetical protein